MKYALCLAAIVATVSAGTISVPIVRQHADEATNARRLASRDTFKEEIYGTKNFRRYLGVVGIGTPPQNFTLHIDTGSSDLWVNSVDAKFCAPNKNGQSKCSATFDPSLSSTYEELDPDQYGEFQISYVDRTKISGLLIEESVTINGAVLVNQTMGLADNTTDADGLLGLGFDTKVSTLHPSKGIEPFKYPTVIDNMLQQGIIKKPVFSLFLGTIQDLQGSLLFGGVDTNKFYDELVTMPMIPEGKQTTPSSYAVQLQNFSVVGLDGVPSGKLAVLLDSGSTQTNLPKAWVDPIMSHFNAQSDSHRRNWVDCAMAKKHGNIKLVFQFTGKVIYAPMSTMIGRDPLDPSTKDVIFKDIPGSENWSEICRFGLSSIEDSNFLKTDVALFGDSFLRNAYIVYDLENKRIGLAQARADSNSEKIIEVSDNGGIPSATGSTLPASFTQGDDKPLPTDPVPQPTNNSSGNSTSGDKHNSATGSNMNLFGSILAAVLISALAL